MEAATPTRHACPVCRRLVIVREVVDTHRDGSSRTCPMSGQRMPIFLDDVECVICARQVAGLQVNVTTGVCRACERVTGGVRTGQ